MFKQIAVLFLICFASLSTFAQTEKFIVPAKWEKYKVGVDEVSILLPRLPISTQKSDLCYELETKEYAVYTDQTIYGFTISSKAGIKAPAYCSTKRRFSEEYFTDRVAELKTELSEFTENKFKQNDLTINEVAGKSKTYWLVNDFENKRWFEMWTMGAGKDKAEVKNFIKSIEIGKNIQGIEIGKGAERTFGDEIAKNSEVKNEETHAVIVGFRPQPLYTDAARQANTQGTVTLKVVFLANGAIGTITPVAELPNGLTEQAITAAQRLVFIPPKRKGVSYAVSKTVTYNFSMY